MSNFIVVTANLQKVRKKNSYIKKKDEKEGQK